MSERPYITYPNAIRSVELHQIGNVIAKCYVNEPGEVSFGVIDYAPSWFIVLHYHHTWELIIIDSSSEGPGYTFFDGHWWRSDPGSGVFIPKGHSHAWSAGNNNGFKMLWVYGGSHEEASHVYDCDPKTFKPITPSEEGNCPVWTAEAALHLT